MDELEFEQARSSAARYDGQPGSIARRWLLVAAALLLCAAAAHAEQSTAARVYASVAPAVVFVETASGSGSGLLLEESTAILTAAHVVYPHRSARVVFPDGTELLDVPLIGWDLMTDVAVLGPVQSEVASPPLDTDGGPAIGSDLFAIGYPAEEEPYPQPAISRGLLSRYRRWPDQGVTYLQTDALVDGGQSGGVLASADGAIVGMTLFGDFGHFWLAICARDVLPRVEALLAGEDPAKLGDRRWDEPKESGPIDVVLHTYWSGQAFVIDAPPGAEVTVTASSTNDIFLEIVDVSGETIAEADETEQGAESFTATLAGTPPFLLIVEQFTESATRVTIDADVGLARIIDPDDGALLRVPAKRAGALDYPYDVDHFRLPLRADEAVRIRVDSTAVDPYLRVDYRLSDDVIADDDSGGGVFGESAELVYRADGSRTYRVVIDDAYGDQMGGYTLTVEPAER